MDLANSHFQLKDFDKAIWFYLDATDIEGISVKESSNAWLAAGEVYLGYNSLDGTNGACECFSKAAELNPNNKTAKMRILLKCQ